MTRKSGFSKILSALDLTFKKSIKTVSHFTVFIQKTFIMFSFSFKSPSCLLLIGKFFLDVTISACINFYYDYQ